MVVKIQNGCLLHKKTWYSVIIGNSRHVSSNSKSLHLYNSVHCLCNHSFNDTMLYILLEFLFNDFLMIFILFCICISFKFEPPLIAAIPLLISKGLVLVLISFWDLFDSSTYLIALMIIKITCDLLSTNY